MHRLMGVAIWMAASVVALTPRDDKRIESSLKAPDGREVHHAIVDGASAPPRRLCLDIVSRQLGLGDGWTNEVKVEKSGVDNVERVRDARGNIVLYLVAIGLDRVAFDASGKALFFDLHAQNLDAKDPLHGNRDVLAVLAELEGLAPNHVVIAADGRVGAWVERPVRGAIASFWTDRDGKGRPIVRYATVNQLVAQSCGG